MSNKQGSINNEIGSLFKRALDESMNKKCWEIVGGKGTGTIISLHFGKKIPLSIPVKNKHLSEDLQHYDGEIILFINCIWRIESDTEVLLGCWEDDYNDPLLGDDLRSLIGQSIESINIFSPAWDLAIHFSNSKTLRIFCDQTSIEEETDNYSLFMPELIFIVGPKGKLRTEERSPS
jgi:hypothetical protein